MNRVVFVILLLHCSLNIIAGDRAVFTLNGVTYVQTEFYTKDVFIREYNGTDAVITIPAVVQHGGKAYNVIKISAWAFKKCTTITKVILPPTISKIERGAFSDCSNLVTINIPEKVTRLEDVFSRCSSLKKIVWDGKRQYLALDGAFSGCKSLDSNFLQGVNVSVITSGCFANCSFTEFRIPPTVTICKDNFFCDNIKKVYAPASVKELGHIEAEVVVDPDNPYFVSVDGVVYNKDKTELVSYPSKKAPQDFIVPNTVKTIGEYAFSRARFTGLVLPSSIKEIKKSAFYYTDVKHLSLPPIETISPYMFSYSTIEEMIIPSSVTSIGERAFDMCEHLKKLVIPPSAKKIDEFAFRVCRELEKVIVPDQFIKGRGVFDGCYKLSDVKGYTVLYPDYLTTCGIPKESPFYKRVLENFNESKNSFSYYVYGYVNQKIDSWQKKREYETTEQWQQRVTADKREQKVKELLTVAKKEYVAQHLPSAFNCTLGIYDADYGVFPLSVSDGTKLYVKVPQSEASTFKDKWEKVEKNPVYGIVNDKVGVVFCTFTLKGKTYALSQTAVDESASMSTQAFTPVGMDVLQGQQTTFASQSKAHITIDHSIDQNIPIGSTNNTNTFAVIIGNEKYQQVMSVPYANNDAKVFAEYCKKTLGLPEKNIRIYENATYGAMLGAMSDIQKIAHVYRGDINVIFYYAGHGIPDEATGDAYLLPIDADGINMRICYPLNQLYKEFGDLRVKSVTCFMDCCFSGAERGNGMVVAARGVAIKAKSDQPIGNTVVFTAATDKQTAFPYKEKGHGMFTYYLLKKLRDSKGDCTLGELGSYISDEVAKQAVVTNGKEQTPRVLTSAGMDNSWKDMKLK